VWLNVAETGVFRATEIWESTGAVRTTLGGVPVVPDEPLLPEELLLLELDELLLELDELLLLELDELLLLELDELLLLELDELLLELDELPELDERPELPLVPVVTLELPVELLEAPNSTSCRPQPTAPPKSINSRVTLKAFIILSSGHSGSGNAQRTRRDGCSRGQRRSGWCPEAAMS
jgi:hypothetical protein